jgi:hypothetical protein
MLVAAPMRARKHGLGLGLLLVVATSVPALAQQPTPSSSSKSDYLTCAKEQNSDAAHAKYLSGKVDYDEGKYDSAIQNFRSAYEKDCTKHDLLIIISRAHELNHNLPEAIRALEVYIEKPGATELGVHRAKIGTLKERLAEERKKAAATPTPTTTTPTPPPEQGHTIYPWLVVGAGVVTLAVGVVLIATVPALPPGCNPDNQTCDRLKNPDGTFSETNAQYEDRQSDAGRHVNQPRIGTAVAVVGGVAIVGGLLWHFLEPTGPKESSKTKVQPQLGPGFGGLALTGRF